jgi:hypothetical protein
LVTWLGGLVVDAILGVIIHVQNSALTGFLLFLALPLFLVELLFYGHFVFPYHVSEVLHILVRLFEKVRQTTILLLVDQLPVAFFIFRLKKKFLMRNSEAKILDNQFPYGYNWKIFAPSEKTFKSFFNIGMVSIFLWRKCRFVQRFLVCKRLRSVHGGATYHQTTHTFTLDTLLFLFLFPFGVGMIGHDSLVQSYGSGLVGLVDIAEVFGMCQNSRQELLPTSPNRIISSQLNSRKKRNKPDALFSFSSPVPLASASPVSRWRVSLAVSVSWRACRRWD